MSTDQPAGATINLCESATLDPPRRWKRCARMTPAGSQRTDGPMAGESRMSRTARWVLAAVFYAIPIGLAATLIVGIVNGAMALSEDRARREAAGGVFIYSDDVCIRQGAVRMDATR